MSQEEKVLKVKPVHSSFHSFGSQSSLFQEFESHVEVMDRELYQGREWERKERFRIYLNLLSYLEDEEDAKTNVRVMRDVCLSRPSSKCDSDDDQRFAREDAKAEEGSFKD